MNRLIIFGDSFVTLERRKDFSFPFWTEQLAEKLGLSLVVHGKGGTNLNWSLINYYNYIKNDYNKEDIIIFVVTSGSRLPYVHQDFDPADGVSSQFLTLGSPWKWNTKNFENELDAAKQVWVRFYNEEIHHAQVTILRQALESLPNKKLVLSAFPDSHEHKLAGYCDFHVRGPALMGISFYEMGIKPGETVKASGMDSMRPDPRPNHLSEQNHKILAEDLYDMLMGKKSLDINNNDYKKLEKIQNA